MTDTLTANWFVDNAAYEMTYVPEPSDPGPPVSTGRTLPIGRKFARLKHDYEVYGVSRPTHNNNTPKIEGLPETIKAVFPVFVDMTKPWQNYWVDLFSLSRFNKLYKDLDNSQREIINRAFRSVTAGYRAFTNRRGWDDGYADYINGENINSPPMQQETINTGGNIVELLSDRVRIGGKDAYKVVTLNAKSLPPDPLEANHIKTPWLVFKATISRRENYDGRKWLVENKIIPFDQLQGYDVPIPFICNDMLNYIEAERIDILPMGADVPDAYG